MPMILREVTVGANATNENIIAGSAFEFARGRGVLSVGIAGAATGLVGTIQVGARVVLEESPLAIKTTMPIIPDDFYYTEGVLQNERIIARVRNTTAAPIVCRSIAQLQGTGGR